MKIHKYVHRCLLLVALLCGSVYAEDIDIFGGTTQSDPNLPNVIFVLDNTSNWSRQAQKWPGGVVQGQSEVKAIKTALAAQVGKLNVGIVEYSTTSNNANNDGGYVRFDLQELTTSSYATLSTTLDTIYNDINGPTEKRDSSNLYGYLPYDFYNYLSGSLQSKNGTGTPTALADASAYTTQWSRFSSPLTADNACGNTYLIFIGNNTNGSIAGDDATNSTALKALYTAAGGAAPFALAGDTGTPMAMPEFACTVEQVVVTPGYTIPAYTDPAYTDPDTVISHPAQPAKYLGDTTACYQNNAAGKTACTTAQNLPGGMCKVSAAPPNEPVPTAGTCSCTSTTSSCGGGTKRRQVVGDIAAYTETIPGTFHPEVYHPEEVVPPVTEPRDVCDTTGLENTTGGKDFNFDDWTKFLYDYGVPVTVTNEDGETFAERISVKTYAIDVFNAQQTADLSGLWFSAANAGHGRYFQAKSEDQIIAAINTSLSDIVAVSSSFSAVALPLSVTNRSQRENEVYIGMFRPAPGKKPRWFGNLKRYQLALFNDSAELADVKLRKAINIENGFATDCAESFWSSDTAAYWENLGVEPPPLGQCTRADAVGKQWSDLPDGPHVEKGGVAQQTREGPAGNSRVLYTVTSNALALISDSDPTCVGGDPVLNYLRGGCAGVGEIMPDAGLRASIHGDVVHSRPLSIRYDEDTVRLFYGANDGLFRAVDTSTGTEKWALVDPTHLTKIQRLYDNSPLVDFEGAAQDAGFTYSDKDYFFDGPVGQLVTYDEPDDPDSEAIGELLSAYIYPIMRRGGRMVYGLDVTDPDEPELLWRQGCPNLDNDTGCTSGFADIGQTWSTPIGSYLAEYTGNDEEPDPIVIFGGGFDDCLNEDQASYPSSCNSANGKGVYLVDGVSGALIKYFATEAPVITEVAPVDLDFDGIVDFVYVADVKGNLYRIRFADLTQDLTELTTVPDGALVPRDNTTGQEWLIEKIATIPVDNGAQRRFYNTPAVALFRGTIFVTIGSGDRERPLEANYPYAADVDNRFYVLLDSPNGDYEAEKLAIQNNTTYTRTVVDLDGSTMFEVGTEMPEGKDLRDFDGWYMSLLDRGEQVANPAASGAGKVFFNTFQPGGVSTGLCERPIGICNDYTVDLFNPKRSAGEQCLGAGFGIPPIIVTVDIPKGCDTDPCYFTPPPDCEGDECQPSCSDPATGCKKKTVCISCGGEPPPGEEDPCDSNSNICELDPVVDPKRGRVYFTDKMEN